MGFLSEYGQAKVVAHITNSDLNIDVKSCGLMLDINGESLFMDNIDSEIMQQIGESIDSYTVVKIGVHYNESALSIELNPLTDFTNVTYENLMNLISSKDLTIDLGSIKKNYSELLSDLFKMWYNILSQDEEFIKHAEKETYSARTPEGKTIVTSKLDRISSLRYICYILGTGECINYIPSASNIHSVIDKQTFIKSKVFLQIGNIGSLSYHHVDMSINNYEKDEMSEKIHSILTH